MSRIFDEIREEAKRKYKEYFDSLSPEEQIREIFQSLHKERLRLRKDVVRRFLAVGPLTTEEIGELLGVSAGEAEQIMKGAR